MKKQLLGLLFGFYSFISFAQVTEYEVRQMTQTATEEQLVTECSRMLQENYYFFAEIITDRLLQMNPESANYHYRKGFIVLDSRLDFVTALPYLTKASTKINKNYDMYSAKEKAAPPDVFYHIGRCYHLDEQIDKAVENYNKFIAETNKKSELISHAQLKLKQCEVAKRLIQNPGKSTIVNLGPKINTIYPEYSPAVSLDGSSLYFTSRRQWKNQETDEFRDEKYNQFPEDIYVTYSDESRTTFTDPTRINFCQPKTNEASISVSSDERIIYTYEDGVGNGDIFYSDFSNNKFSEMKHFDTKGVNTKFWETHVSVTPDGQQMYFASDRTGGYGKRDIYRIVKLPNGEWSDPINLGPTINTADDEDSPFIAIDNKTLYYASNGEMSMGWFDIFVSIRDEEGTWSNPINVGYPINSTGDDIFYTTTFDGLTGYLTSFRKGGLGEKDIYQVDNKYSAIANAAVLKGVIRTKDGSQIPEETYMTLKCTNCDNAIESTLKPRLRDGAFFSNLTPCRDYEIKLYVDSTATSYYLDTFSTSCTKKLDEIFKEYVIDVDKKVIYPDILFTLAGTVADAQTAVLLSNASVSFIDEKGNIVETVKTDDKGKFVSTILDDKYKGQTVKYDVKVTREDYIAQSFVFTATLGKERNLTVNYLLEKYDIGKDLSFAINPIYFDLNKADIRPDAKIELDKIVKILNDNPKIKIELGSHTDCRNSKAYNQELSQRRAKNSAAYLKTRITNPARVSYKGYGETKLINHCECEGTKIIECSEEEHQLNRRTEFRIVQ